jgi:hypothetical protein
VYVYPFVQLLFSGAMTLVNICLVGNSGIARRNVVLMYIASFCVLLNVNWFFFNFFFGKFIQY